MIITDIQKVYRKNKYDVYVDGEKAFQLSDVGIINCGLKVGREFEKEELNELVSEAIKADVFETLLNILGQTALTEGVAKTKLRQKGFDDENIDFAIEKAISYGYINDKEYAKSYIQYTKNKSKLRITSELFKKGIEKYIFDEFLNDYDELEACKNAMRSHINGELDKDEQKKLFQRFYMQGFPIETIKQAYFELLDYRS